eukprot:TRINITY_DN8293_c0_g1_i8.p1 TRINITY_DN8293_c0_g1~~TRINITY_DN8293_c0_g1_i8.p1  ORF type:complete len:232 (+),score=67.32 TRINITY_DN8293_c0_g1_i8:33-728(+)
MLCLFYLFFFFFQAEDGIRDAQESRGLGDVYKRQFHTFAIWGVFSLVLVRFVNSYYVMPYKAIPWEPAIAAVVCYLLMVGWVKHYHPASKELPTWANADWMVNIVALWNLGLAMASIAMFAGIVQPFVSLMLSGQFVQAICNQDAYFGSVDGVITSNSQFWNFLFGLSKFAELVDTMILAVRRKPIIFLHWYHHWTVLATTTYYLHVRFVPGILFGTVSYTHLTLPTKRIV